MIIYCEKLNQLDASKLSILYEQDSSDGYNGLKNNLQYLQAKQDFYGFLMDFFQIRGAFYAIWQEKERYVCALRAEPYRDGYLIEGLITASSDRGKGYGQALLANTVDKLKDYSLYSHVRKDNLASCAVHRRCGFEILKESAVYIDGSVDANAYTFIKKQGHTQ